MLRATADPQPLPRALLLILAVALAARLIVGQIMPADDRAIDRLPDQREYLAIAQNLLAGKGLTFTDPRFNQSLHAYRAPGYPLCIAAAGANIRAVRAIQAVLDTSAVLAAWLLARRLLPNRAALTAACLVAINPLLIYFSTLLLSETLFTAMLIWGLALLWPSRSRALSILGMLILCAMPLVRPSALLLSTFLILLIPGSIPTRLARAAISALLTLALLLPWAIRNLHDPALARPIFTTTNAGITLFDGLSSAATGASNQQFVESMPALRDKSEVARDQYLRDQAIQFVRENPTRALQLALIKIARTWSPWPLSRDFGRPLYVAVSAAYTLPLYFLAAVGLFRLPRFSRGATMFCLLPAIYFSLACAIAVGSLRYRLPADAPLAVIAASAFTRRAPAQPGTI